MGKKASERAGYWADHVAQWRDSAQTQAAYCRIYQLSASSLNYWIKRSCEQVRRTDEKPLSLVPVQIQIAAPCALPSSSSSGDVPALLRSPSGWSLALSALPPPAWLVEVFAHEVAR